jgi:DNA-binding MarR family transcriptional regulator
VNEELTAEDYRALAEFRYQIRRFLHFSEEQARAAGIEPQQHQLMLALKGLPAGSKPTIGELADRLQLRHHSVVELVNRLESQGAVARNHSHEDRREVLVDLTPAGEELLRKLTILHRQELNTSGRTLARVLRRVVERGKRVRSTTA